MNDSRLNNLNSLITSLMRNEKKPEKIIQSIYLRVLSRPATEPEITRMKKFLEGDREQKRAYSDIFWALLNSSEFVFNH